ncbi:MAG: ChbG/HpnK family deacetylase [Burkholderiales bacterium]
MIAAPRRVVVCADDFGLGDAIDEGIVGLAASGRIAAQWTVFELPRGGGAPDFVDTHRHVHVLAPVREALLAVSSRSAPGVPVRNLHPSFGPRGSLGKRGVLRLAGACPLEARLRETGRLANAAFGGLQSFHDVSRVPADWIAMLARAPDGALVATHPASRADPADPIGAFREAERDWLASDGFVEACGKAGVRLATLREIAPAAKR